MSGKEEVTPELNLKDEEKVEIIYYILSTVLGVQATKITQRKSTHRLAGEKIHIKTTSKIIYLFNRAREQVSKPVYE